MVKLAKLVGRVTAIVAGLAFLSSTTVLAYPAGSYNHSSLIGLRAIYSVVTRKVFADKTEEHKYKVDSTVVSQNGDTVIVESTVTSRESDSAKYKYSVPITAIWNRIPGTVLENNGQKTYNAIQDTVFQGRRTNHQQKGSVSSNWFKEASIQVSEDDLGIVTVETTLLENTPVSINHPGYALWLLPELMSPASGVVLLEGPRQQLRTPLITNAITPSSVTTYFAGMILREYDNAYVNWQVWYDYFAVQGDWDSSLGRFVSESHFLETVPTSPINNWWVESRSDRATVYPSTVEGVSYAVFRGVFPLGYVTDWKTYVTNNINIYQGSASGYLRSTIWAFDSYDVVWEVWKDETFVNGTIPEGTTTEYTQYIL